MTRGRRRWLGMIVAACGLSALPAVSQEPAAEKPKAVALKEKEEGWKPLFNGKDLSNWKKSGFSGEGEVDVDMGVMVLRTGGGPITGITFTKDFPKTNFEIRLEARRAMGTDFFCGLTFPVDDSHASLICGGWGGTVTGISSIDGYDASENASSKYIKYENGQWYEIRVRVTPEKIEAWIDGKQEIDVELDGRRISTRIEVDRSKPLGLSAFETQSEIRKIEWRPVKAEGSK